MKKFAGKYQEPLLELNLHHLTLVFSLMKHKPVLLKHSNCSHSSGLDILMIFFTWTHMESNLNYFSMILTNFIRT